MTKNKKGRGALIFFNALLLVQYIALLYLILAEFKFIPWYASDASFILYYFLWLPLCLTTLITVAVSFFSGRRERSRIMLLCYNAMIMPLLFAADFMGSAVLSCLIAAVSLITVAVYAVLTVLSIKNKTL